MGEAGGWSVEGGRSVPSGASRNFPAMRTELTISGMVAVHARHAVFTALAGVAGIARAEVELGRAVIEHDAGVTPEALADAVAGAGFAVTAVRELPRALPTL